MYVEKGRAWPGEGSRGSGTPILSYENEYYLKRKTYRNPPLEIPRDEIFFFEEEQKKINLKMHRMLYRRLQYFKGA